LGVTLRLAKGGYLTKSDEYEQRAAECMRLAQSFTEPNNKIVMLHMAAAWIRLALKAQGEEPGAEEDC
jgi:hypothetical protein